ncbi:MAG: RHS repeat-associated core domain-containing protein [Leptolyngbyaceae cyanobacterium]
MIDNSGTVLNHIVHNSFGQITSESDPTFNFRFGYTGRELDEETGMMYYRARYFDPAGGIV